MNLTDNETIEALECCSDTASRCDECSYYREGDSIITCSMIVMKNALDLINRQKAVNKLQAKEIVDLKIKVKEQRAEIEKFKKIDHFAQKTIDLQTAEIKKLEAEIERLRGKNKSIRYCYEQAKSYNDTLAESCEKNCKKFNMTTRAEVIKEFWGKTKKYFKKNICFFTPEDESELIQYGDNLAKEMVGE